MVTAFADYESKSKSKIFLTKSKNSAKKSLEKIDISEKIRKFSRNLEQILEKFRKF